MNENPGASNAPGMTTATVPDLWLIAILAAPVAVACSLLTSGVVANRISRPLRRVLANKRSGTGENVRIPPESGPSRPCQTDVRKRAVRIAPHGPVFI